MDGMETWGHLAVVGSSGVILVTRVVEGRGRPDLAVVNAVARWQLHARRAGGYIVLWGLDEDLTVLLDLVGLLREVSRKCEQGKELLGVEEGVDTRDSAR